MQLSAAVRWIRRMFDNTAYSAAHAPYLPRVYCSPDRHSILQHLPKQLTAAVRWIRRIFGDAAYNTTHAAHLQSLPAADEVLAPEMWTDAMVVALQCPVLVRLWLLAEHFSHVSAG